MTDLFIKAANMSLNAGYLVIAVIILRLILKRAPKWLHCLLWGIVGLKLVIPFSFESVLSLIPSKEIIPQGIAMDRTPTLNSGIPIVDKSVNPIITNTFAPDPLTSANPLQILLFMAAIVWFIGIAAMLIYCAASYIRLRIKVRASILYRDNIYYCDNIDTPFILGVIKPKIYIPSDINKANFDYVIKHENAHLKRCDHITKLIGYLILCVYWFNPLIWLGYILLCRDIEKACDQKAVKDMDTDSLKVYASALLDCSIKRKYIAACPLAFGEVGVKGRIKALLNYKKPAFWVIIVAIILCIATAICFLTNPITDKEPSYNKTVGNVTVIENSPSENGLSIRLINAVLDGEKPYFDIEWINNSNNEIAFGESFEIYRIENGKQVSCVKEELFFHSLAHILNPHGSTTERYYLNAFDLSKTGTYRFSITDFPGRELWIDFEIKKATQSNVGGADSSNIKVSSQIASNSISYTPLYITNIYSLSRKNLTEDFKLYKSFDENAAVMKSYLSNTHLKDRSEGAWVKFNPARPNNHRIVLNLYNGECKIINIHFSKNSGTYFVAIATDTEPFNINKDYSKLEYTRYVASDEFGEFLSSMLDWDIIIGK